MPSCHKTGTATLVLGLMCLATVATAQTASLTGSVLTDPGERPLANAEVSLPTLGKSVRTDSAGNFRITGIPAGTHAIFARLVGFSTATAMLPSGLRAVGGMISCAIPTRRILAVEPSLAMRSE
jgi:hypothetical protein